MSFRLKFAIKRYNAPPLGKRISYLNKTHRRKKFSIQLTTGNTIYEK
jgi:hypothetical protein